MSSVSLQAFSKAMKEGPCHIQINIFDIPDYYDTVVQNLRDQRHEGQPINNAVISELRGICPACCTWLDSTLLYQPSMIRKIGRDQAILNGYGSIGRLLDGCCPNFDCDSKKILLIWQGRPDIKMHIEDLVRLNLKEKDAVSRFIRQDVMSYVVDAISIQRMKETPLHIYTGRKSREGDICIWVSVMQGFPNEEEYKKKHFPTGYAEFLNRLLAESSYSSDSVAVMHWIHGYKENICKTFLSFVDILNNKGQKGWLILPNELLQDYELEKLGRHQS